MFLARQGTVLDCRFRYRATGPHQLELTFEGGERATLSFRAYLPGVLHLESESGGTGATLRVFHRSEGYGEVMASTLRNLLADFRVQ